MSILFELAAKTKLGVSPDHFARFFDLLADINCFRAMDGCEAQRPARGAGRLVKIPTTSGFSDARLCLRRTRSTNLSMAILEEPRIWPESGTIPSLLR